MLRPLLFRAPNRPRAPAFSAPPPALSAVAAAALEPLVAWAVFTVLWRGAGLEPSRADLTLLLLCLALTFPAPDRIGRPWLQRVSEATVSWSLLVVVLVLCGWATRSLHLVDLNRWGLWALWTPVTHQVLLSGLGLVISRRRVKRPLRRAVVVGTGDTARRLARALRRTRDAQGPVFRFLGWVQGPALGPAGALSARVNPLARSGPADLSPQPHRPQPHRLRLGDMVSLAERVRRGEVDDIFLAVDAPLGGLAPQTWEALHDSTVAVHVVPDLAGALLLQGRVRTLEGLPVVSLLESPFTGLNAAIKRLEDLLLAGLAVLLLWPMMVAIAVWVRLDSPGPVLFRQARLGMGGQVIEVWKFRTMRDQPMPDLTQAQRHDPRVTRAGRFLRRTSLDELPQFINVLQGRMSVVGPRPHALVHNEQYRGLVRAYMLRHKVRPGITGWAQVNGLRGETDTVDKMRRRIEHDLDYLRNWSPAFDLQIVLRTVGLVFKDAHAY